MAAAAAGTGLSLLAKLGVGAWSRLVGPKEDIREVVNCTERGRDPENWKGEDEKGDGALCSLAWSTFSRKTYQKQAQPRTCR